MPQTHILDIEGARLLSLLVRLLPNVEPRDPSTFISYKDAHDRLQLSQVRETWGESLKAQGLISLAEWTNTTGKPAITGLIIDRSSMMPGRGYFDLFGRPEEDFIWWAQEIARAKDFDWRPYLPPQLLPELPTSTKAPSPAERQETTINRVVRDTNLSRHIKKLHNYECQICGYTILLPDGTRYAEAHHIQPLGTPHNGPDVPENLICVCPNHHAELDFGARPLELTKLRSTTGHTIEEKFAVYHNKYVYRERVG